ncbi:MAG: hypothetical protein ACTSXH_03660 [Promethearchaeota archaeon]
MNYILNVIKKKISEVRTLKKITFNISFNLSGMSQGKTFIVNVKDDATFVEALAIVDKQDMEHPEKSIFPLFKGYIQNYLQLFWDPQENKIYDDVGLQAYGPDEEGNLRKFMPLRENIEFNLYPNSVIDLQPDPGC